MGDERKQLIFNDLSVEITRKCNMSCSHCFMGNAQDVDLSHEDIDSLLDQVAQIEHILFTGGEPTLNIAGMRYFLDGCIKRNIKIQCLEIVTNGKVISDDFISLILDYNEWIDKYTEDRWYKNNIILGVSCDKYHEIGIGEKAIQTLQDYFGQIQGIRISEVRSADFYLLRQGRALSFEPSLENKLREAGQQLKSRRSKIEMLEEGHICYCPYRKVEDVPPKGQARVLCKIIVTSNGDLHSSRHDGDPVISNTKKLIYDDIVKYNNNISIPLCVENNLNYNNILISIGYLIDIVKKANAINGGIINEFKEQTMGELQRVYFGMSELPQQYVTEDENLIVDEFCDNNPDKRELVNIRKEVPYLSEDEQVEYYKRYLRTGVYRSDSFLAAIYDVSRMIELKKKNTAILNSFFSFDGLIDAINTVKAYGAQQIKEGKFTDSADAASPSVALHNDIIRALENLS